VSINSLIFK
ncbi:DNA gyrase/topoisomerase IV, subunit A family protein, partial [Chlamydia psittaci 84-8471/1]